MTTATCKLLSSPLITAAPAVSPCFIEAKPQSSLEDMIRQATSRGQIVFLDESMIGYAEAFDKLD